MSKVQDPYPTLSNMRYGGVKGSWRVFGLLENDVMPSVSVKSVLSKLELEVDRASPNHLWEVKRKIIQFKHEVCGLNVVEVGTSRRWYSEVFCASVSSL